MKIEDATQIQVMDRIQCLRNINESIQERIDRIKSQREDCCDGSIDNGLTLEGEYITLGGEIITLA